MTAAWHTKVLGFLSSQERNGLLAPSVANGPKTLYGGVYLFQAGMFLGRQPQLRVGDFRHDLESWQEPESGLVVGPEFSGFSPSDEATHDLLHLKLHSTCTVLPFIRQCGLKLPHPITFAEQFLDPENLKNWLNARCFQRAWLEGNNILFVGQLLVYLRDVERKMASQAAVLAWLQWLDDHADSRTGLWGTDGACSDAEGVYGGYHQYLVYYHERRPVPNPTGVVDTVLGLQHADGGFNPKGNGGACEDVDCVDILVNMYKRHDYRRPEVRVALRKCLHHILSTQNSDGGFPYNRDRPQSHMGIPGTNAPANVSCAFPTWFRIHTLALIAEILPDEAEFAGVKFRFNSHLSMGWHRSPEGWCGPDRGPRVKGAEAMVSARQFCSAFSVVSYRRLRSGVGSALRKVGIRRGS